MVHRKYAMTELSYMTKTVCATALRHYYDKQLKDAQKYESMGEPQWAASARSFAEHAKEAWVEISKDLGIEEVPLEID